MYNMLADWIKEAIGWMVAVVFGAISWLFSRSMKKHDDEIAEMRGDIKELYGKHDLLKDYINTRMEAVETKIMTQISALRTDMNGGMSGIREELRHMNRPTQRRD